MAYNKYPVKPNMGTKMMEVRLKMHSREKGPQVQTVFQNETYYDIGYKTTKQIDQKLVFEFKQNRRPPPKINV